MKKIISTNSAKNYEIIGEVVSSTKEEILEKIKYANQTKESWRRLGLSKRIELLRKTKELFRSHEQEIVDLIVKEIGTARVEASGEVSWDWGYWDYFLNNAENILAPFITKESDGVLHKQVYEPIGTSAVITPWNLPFDMFVWGVIPNLLVGNTVLYKASEECVLSGKLYEDIMGEVGFPKGVFSSIHGDGEEGAQLVQGDIDLIWFTGSSEVGHKLYETAGKKFIRATLEMGGSNPAIVFPDADLEMASNSIKTKRFMFVGQTCDADKRLIIHKSIKDKFITLFSKQVESINVGDPEKNDTEMGSIVSLKQLKLLNAQLRDALDKGARIIAQARIDNGLEGAYFAPVLLDNITKDMRVWREEVFGPILPIVSFETEEEAIQLANDTEYGLGSQVFTADMDLANRVASELKAGNVDINGVGHFIPENPFGGYKNSGIGREHGIHGLLELCQLKTISQPK